MARNLTTVVVTVTDYTTVYPTLLPTTSNLEVFPSVTQIPPVGTLSPNVSTRPSLSTRSSLSTRTSLSTKPSLSTFKTSIRSTHISSPTPSSSLHVSFSTSVSSSLTTSSEVTALPTGWPNPSDAPQEKHHNNALPILMMIFLVTVALFFLGALVYFAFRLARGHCEDCRGKTAEIIHLKQRLAGKEPITPAMVQRREAELDQAAAEDGQRSEKVVISEEALKQGIGFMLPREVFESGFTIVRDGNKADDEASVQPSDDSKRFTPFHYDKVELPRAASSLELHRQLSATSSAPSSTIWQNRAQALETLTNQNNEEATPSFWNLKRFFVGPPPNNAVAEQQRALVGLRTYSNPGPAPSAPVHRPENLNPYTFNSQAAHFDTTGRSDSDSGRGSSEPVPQRYPQPRREPIETGFITIAVDDATAYGAETEEERARRADWLRQKRRTGGYGGMASLLTPSMQWQGPVPSRL
ncbi:hypothetical protein BU23DRAFT_656899 [Bimuria novae-zelandiae CBS 107.79]|uniref:Uncharacterized protein n=1 Tax=Bimuria novae-zelandiae CBS 107.79 TaxID=1447943 RepID=A0A6A5V4A1_9PLEO|nr:hypothetical protein BU23DRAFT_656899 [Bimuria novae-zelandiae CBS 107.79]